MHMQFLDFVGLSVLIKKYMVFLASFLIKFDDVISQN